MKNTKMKIVTFSIILISVFLATTITVAANEGIYAYSYAIEEQRHIDTKMIY